MRRKGEGKGSVEWAYPGYPVERLGAGRLSCWPARMVELDGWSSTILIFSDFQDLRCGPELSGPLWIEGWRVRWGPWECGAGGEHPRIKELKEGRVTGLEGRCSKDGSCVLRKSSIVNTEGKGVEGGDGGGDGGGGGGGEVGSLSSSAWSKPRSR